MPFLFFYRFPFSIFTRTNKRAMLRNVLRLIPFIILPFMGTSQEFTRLMKSCADSSEFKIVFRTEEDTGVREVTVDNMTVLVKGDTTHLYYMRYGDGLVSKLMIPYNITDQLIDLENEIISKSCKIEGCEYSVRIDLGEKSERIPIDVLSVELISTFMLNQE